MHFAKRTVILGGIQKKYVLDKISGAVAAYSLNQLKSNATLCIKVRRGVDNEELNIGFKNGKYDVARLRDFLSTNTGYTAHVTRWYDQTGNVNIAYATSTSTQPIIAFGTAINDGLYFANPMRLLINNAPSLDIAARPLTMVYDIKRLSDSPTSFIIAKNTDAAANAQYAVIHNSTGSNTPYLEGASRNATANFSNDVYTTGMHVWDANGVITHYKDGVESGSRYSSYTGGLTSRPWINIGCRSSAADGSARSSYYKGYMWSVLIFNTDITADVVRLHAALAKR
jgi:hypothetical protein